MELLSKEKSSKTGNLRIVRARPVSMLLTSTVISIIILWAPVACISWFLKCFISDRLWVEYIIYQDIEESSIHVAYHNWVLIPFRNIIADPRFIAVRVHDLQPNVASMGIQ